jgi:hypothetical protein
MGVTGGAVRFVFAENKTGYGHTLIITHTLSGDALTDITGRLVSMDAFTWNVFHSPIGDIWLRLP